MKKMTLVLVVALALASAVSGLELKDGRMRLVIDDRTGRFALYYLEDVARNKYVPLLYAEETRTTYTTLLYDQKTYKLGDASEFRASVARDGSGGARIEFKSSFCVVRQTFAFVSSPGSTMPDGVLVDFVIENVAQKDAPVGLRLLFDTWLGEKSQAHFSAQAAGALLGESALYGDFQDAWIRSANASGGSTSEASLQIQLAAPATRPDRLVAANWKRLNDAAWSFDANPSRNFTLLPYSINDSALALYYEPVEVRPGSTRGVSVLLSQANDGYPVAAAGTQAAAPAISAPSETAPLDEMVDLIAVRNVLEAINAAMASGADVPAAEIQALEAILQRLETRKAKY
jgi:hypothetical protein